MIGKTEAEIIKEMLAAAEERDAGRRGNYRRIGGPGSTRTKAISVLAVKEEHDHVKEKFGRTAWVAEQSLMVYGERRYDRLTVQLDDDRWTYLWFDITEYWAEHEKRLAEWRRDRAK